MENHKNKILTVPNALTFLRFFLSAYLVLFLQGQWLMILIIGTIASLTDLDGWFARKFGWESKLGQALDPVADKILVVCIIFLINPWLSLWVAILEFVGAILSNYVRSGGYIIAHGSKGITVSQMACMLILVCNRIPDVAFFTVYEESLYGVMLALSWVRLCMYGSHFYDKITIKK